MDVACARNGDAHLAYTVVGEGPIDLVYTNGIWSNLEALWEEPRWRCTTWKRAAAFWASSCTQALTFSRQHERRRLLMDSLGVTP